MRNLRDQFKDILKETAGEEQAIDANTNAWIIYDDSWDELILKLLKIIKERDKYIIGKNMRIPKHGYSIGNLGDMVHTVNESGNYIRTEQRKRAKETL